MFCFNFGFYLFEKKKCSLGKLTWENNLIAKFSSCDIINFKFIPRHNVVKAVLFFFSYNPAAFALYSAKNVRKCIIYEALGKGA
jgi:hypothetical protein